MNCPKRHSEREVGRAGPRVKAHPTLVLFFTKPVVYKAMGPLEHGSPKGERFLTLSSNPVIMVSVLLAVNYRH